MLQSTLEATLEEITAQTLMAVLDLDVSPGQQANLASNAVSIAEAHFNPGAWFRAVYSGGVPVGFVMLFDPTIPGATATDPLEPTDIVLWRLMIDRRYQGRGLGRAALDLVRRHIAGLGGFRRLVTSYVPGPDEAEPFYRAYGFKKTGRTWEDGREIEIALEL
jgi:diamine N-acetyltransferase